jgi:GNAT superfamily N-acetyltransferase
LQCLRLSGAIRRFPRYRAVSATSARSRSAAVCGSRVAHPLPTLKPLLCMESGTILAPALGPRNTRSAAVAETSFRLASAADAPALGAGIAAGFDGFRRFAPADWTPPSAARETELVSELLKRDTYWCQVAELRGVIVGQVAFLPATDAYLPSDEPGLAHLCQLFVDPELWGTGLAATLHGAALREAAARDFDDLRLFAPTGQTRACRFYEREGWILTGPPFIADSGLEAVTYRRSTKEQ